jgi:NADH dehydrogenase
MNKYLRRGISGLIAGAVCSLALVSTVRDVGTGVVVGMFAGIGYALVFPPAPRAYFERALTASAFGAPLWCLVNVITLPLEMGNAPQWTSEGMRAAFPSLIGWVLFGAGLGLVTQVLNDATTRVFGAEFAPPPPAREIKTRILILGGGFAGVATARHLEKLFGPDPSVEFTLVSDTNALLFTPMLAEVAASSLEPTHISTPLRTSLRRTQVIRRAVSGIDLARRRVRLTPDARDEKMPRELHYDQLVLALGAVSNYMGMQSVAAHALDFKSLTDAIRIRNRVIDLIERAEHETDVARRRALLTFVIAGGGFAGVELAGGLNDFVRGVLVDYPNLRPDEVRVLLVHARERILPELSEGLANYTLQKMAARGVQFKLNARVAEARQGAVMLNSHEEIAAETLVWTAGTQPHPLVRQLGVELDQRGAVVTDGAFVVKSQQNLWAIGDCACIPDAQSGQVCPPTAQYALREAKTLAYNVRASVRGQPLKNFHFRPLGISCVVGHHTACIELTIPLTKRTIRFSGLLAWLGWRAIYLAKLPGLERQVRVMVDWVIELFFPRDIVQTLEFD